LLCNVKNEKALGETQTLSTACSKVEPNIFALRQTPSRGRGTAKMVTTSTYRPRLVKVNARNFELSR